MIYKRNVFPKVLQAVRMSPVVLLLGARQTGKTTLMQHFIEQGYEYITFDDIRRVSAAREDPIGFIKSFNNAVILDEIQRVPELFLPIKQNADKEHQKGKFILTGSANPLLLPKVADSLAGRMILCTLFPLSQGEIQGKIDGFVDFAFSHKKGASSYPAFTKSQLIDRLLVGGYPSNQDFSSDEIEMWCNSYLTTILQRDIRDIAHIEGMSEFPRLLQLLAVRAGNQFNVSDLSRSLQIPVTTLNRYLNILQALFFIHLQPSWNINLTKRVVKSKKIYLNDTAILTYLLGINKARLLDDSRLLGQIVENFVVCELLKQISWSSIRAQLFHFRTESGIEVDIILEDAAGKVVGIEVKSSETVQSDDFKGLRFLQEEIQDRFVRGYVLYLGDETITFGKDLYAYPLNALWNITK